MNKQFKFLCSIWEWPSQQNLEDNEEYFASFPIILDKSGYFILNFMISYMHNLN